MYRVRRGFEKLYCAASFYAESITAQGHMQNANALCQFSISTASADQADCSLVVRSRSKAEIEQCQKMCVPLLVVVRGIFLNQDTATRKVGQWSYSLRMKSSGAVQPGLHSSAIEQIATFAGTRPSRCGKEPVAGTVFVREGRRSAGQNSEYAGRPCSCRSSLLWSTAECQPRKAFEAT
ncbi:hypothetical protein DOTSEDRAFT_70511 [Dothistroma septosporum NZE10]|uniref:Uncharacterized protein n=1 Tax=Dothistroma septosporum (strain NZE10 / CBS 128990) TaxID=675120 RepID=N1PVZ0_DOTSN|nr:hypothetical protein DOTSEDRAFT_70511 [Dothistroma septosporum NZE10]